MRKQLNDNQRRHLRRVVDHPGTVRSGVCLGNGWNAQTFSSLRKRGLITSDVATRWYYHPTALGLSELNTSFD